MRELHGDAEWGYQAGVLQRFDEAVETLVDAGAEVVEVSCPSFDYALAAYYLILPSEASQQPRQVRRDALRPAGRRRRPTRPSSRSWPPAGPPGSATRSSGASSSAPTRCRAGYYDAYYGSAQKVRTLDPAGLRRRVRRGRTSSSRRPRRRRRSSSASKLDDPLAMYLNDVATIPANLAGVPGDVPARRARRRRTACPSASRSWPRRWPTTGSTGWAARSRRRCSTDGAAC